MRSPNQPTEALKVAIDLGDLDLCRRIVETDPAVNLEDDLWPGLTPLLYSLHTGQTAIGEYFVSTNASTAGTAGESLTTRGYDAFHYAAGFGFPGVLRALLEKDVKTVLSDYTPVHPIHLAVANGHAMCVSLLIDAAGNGDLVPSCLTTDD